MPCRCASCIYCPRTRSEAARLVNQQGLALPSAFGRTCLFDPGITHLFHEIDLLNYYMRVTFFENFETCENLLNTLKIIGFKDLEMNAR